MALIRLVRRLLWRPSLTVSCLPNERPDEAGRGPGEPGPWHPSPGRIGVSCSGGGVRSASFCLGALQALDEKQELARADYVTAVSGGGYIASALAIANRGTRSAPARPAGDDGRAAAPRLFAQGSPEERWVRLRSSHLLADARVYISGASRLIAGIAFGWFLLWLLLFGVSRLTGWAISAAHPELRARLPIAAVTGQPDLVRVDVVQQPGTPRYQVVPVFTCGTAQLWSSTSGDERTTTLAAVAVDAPGVVQVDAGRAEILAQPAMRVVTAAPDQVPGDGACAAVTHSEAYTPPPGFAVRNGDGRPTLAIKDQPSIGLTSTGVAAPADDAAAQVRRLVEVSRPASITQLSGMTGRPDMSPDYWQWLVGLFFLAAGVLLSFVVVVYRPVGKSARRIFRWSAAGFAVVGAALLAVLVVLPWCVEAIPPFLASLLHGQRGGPSADGSSSTDVVIALLGLSGVMATAVRTFGNHALRAGRSQLGGVTKVVVGILVPLAGFMVFIDLLEFATANGPNGRYIGFGVGMHLASSPLAADWARLVLVCAFLLLLLVLVDAHAWSLYPFYKRRLNGAYATTRGGNGNIREIRYDDGPTLIRGVKDHPEPFAKPAEVSHDVVVPGIDGQPGPRLVLCCAANVSSEKLAPPGRRAVSFTVSGDWIGSSELGWVKTAEYEQALGTRRLSDATIVSMMAISGAAVSPGMGKMGRPWLRGLLAVLNIRLGVWLPNPAWAQAEQRHVGDAKWWWKSALTRPSWLWFLREIFGIYRPRARYLYVSDGGHWENLGVVELLRRGCTNIYCISAAGDGPQWFSTLGDALALARETMGIEFDIDLSPLRPDGDPPSSGRRLLPRPKKRRGKDVDPTPKPWAPKPFVVGTFTYPGDRRVRGRIMVVEANLTASMPWDVQAWAEAHDKFPDDPTADQLFDHRQFESYRALGHHQVATGLRSDEWDAAGQSIDGRSPAPTPAPALVPDLPAPPAIDAALPRNGASRPVSPTPMASLRRWFVQVRSVRVVVREVPRSKSRL